MQNKGTHAHCVYSTCAEVHFDLEFSVLCEGLRLYDSSHTLLHREVPAMAVGAKSWFNGSKFPNRQFVGTSSADLILDVQLPEGIVFCF